jgi:hypothetical protein
MTILTDTQPVNPSNRFQVDTGESVFTKGKDLTYKSCSSFSAIGEGKEIKIPKLYAGKPNARTQ